MRLTPTPQKQKNHHNDVGRIREISEVRFVAHTDRTSDSPSIGSATSIESVRAQARRQFHTTFIFRYETKTTLIGDEVLDETLLTPEFVEEVSKF